MGGGIKGFIPTSVIQGTLPFIWEASLWKALSVVSQKWSVLKPTERDQRHALPKRQP